MLLPLPPLIAVPLVERTAVAGRIADADVALVRERATIDRVVGEHLQLRPAGGGNLKGLCPFHDEKSPSFQVSPAKGVGHCFGCQWGGDVIRFVRDIEHLSFTEAVEHLAGRYGVQLHYEGGGSGVRQDGRGQRQRLVEANVEAQAFYAEQLAVAPGAGVGRDFLAERGFDAAAAQHFGVGFAPDGWDALTQHLSGRGFSRGELVTAGLAKESARGTLIDRFRGRLVWPIRELSGDLVGFGARRLLPDDQGPKYLNTPETPLYKKSRLLYGVDLAKGDIARRRQAVVVEGYTDVMACHLAGVTTAVATCGTAFGEEHVTVLRRLLLDTTGDAAAGSEVVFTFDGDAAGQKAAEKAGALDQKFSASTYVAVAPAGQDPCELRLSGGDAAVTALVRGRVPLFEFVLRATAARYDLDTPEGRTAALEQVTPVLRGIKDEGLRLAYVPIAARILGFDDAAPVRARVLDRVAARGRQVPAPRVAIDRSAQVERELLKAVLQVPGQVGPGFDALDESAFGHPVSRQVHASLVAAGGVAVATTLGDAAWVARAREAAPDDAVRAQVTAMAVEPLLAPPGDGARGRYVAELLPALSALSIDRRLVEVKGRWIRSAEGSEEWQELFRSVMDLETQRRRLRAGAA